MEDLFGNIFYLIPVALFVALRLVGSRKANNKNQPQNRQQQQDRPQQQKRKSPGGPLKEIHDELIRKIQEAQRNPDYAEGRTEAREVYIPSVAPKEARQVSVQRPRKPGEVKKVKKPSVVMPQTVIPAEREITESVTPAAKETKVTPVAQTTSVQTAEIKKELTQLQQAVVWAEILGQPKGLSFP